MVCVSVRYQNGPRASSSFRRIVLASAACVKQRVERVWRWLLVSVTVWFGGVECLSSSRQLQPGGASFRSLASPLFSAESPSPAHDDECFGFNTPSRRMRQMRSRRHVTLRVLSPSERNPTLRRPHVLRAVCAASPSQTPTLSSRAVHTVWSCASVRQLRGFIQSVVAAP